MQCRSKYIYIFLLQCYARKNPFSRVHDKITCPLRVEFLSCVVLKIDFMNVMMIIGLMNNECTASDKKLTGSRPAADGFSRQWQSAESTIVQL